MKKLIALVLAVMMMALCFAGCQNDNTDPTNAPDTTNPPASTLTLKTGDKVVIVCTAHNKALSSVTVATHYLQGVDVTVADNKVTGYGDTEVWTVTANDDGSYSFEIDGKKLSMQDEYSSVNLGFVNDKWEIVTLDSGAYVLKNIVREQYLEWYDSKNNWSAYNKNWETSDLFHLSFFVVG